MHLKNILVLLCSAYFSFSFLHAADIEPESTGTLIVTYQTGCNRERLDRIRFALISENKGLKIFPKSNTFVEDPYNASRTVVIDHLKPGKYQVEFLVPNTDNIFDIPQKREITVSAQKATKVNQVIKPKYASIHVAATVAPEEQTFETAPKITLQSLQDDMKVESLGGKLVHHQLFPGKYLLSFHEVQGFQTPEPVELSLEPNEHLGPIEALYTHNEELAADPLAVEPQQTQPLVLSDIQKTVLVPGGKCLMGNAHNGDAANTSPQKIVQVDAYHIGIYLVTNAQYAEWLNKAWREGKITFHTQAEQRGFITDKEERLLFKTLEGDVRSQIYTHITSEGPHFLPMVGKHNFPVILVSWHGAQAYCQSYHLRLPTEAEWEKAAGMENTPPEAPLKKYTYGFSRNTIDATWANYRSEESSPESQQVLTSKVGFYNGSNKIPKTPYRSQEELTHKAQSPCGAYDMSGNVWEWINDWHSDDPLVHLSDHNPQGPASGIKKVAKGGCFDSLAEGVRVAERLALPPEHTDIYTGFRVAADLPASL